MVFRDKTLRGVPVFTKSGERIGKVSALVIDTVRHVVSEYVVARTRSLSHLLPNELTVSPAQVISLDSERMVVDDTSVLIEAAAAMHFQEKAINTTSAATSSAK